MFTPRLISRALLALAALALVACGGPPTELLKEASTALNDAALARKCAPEEFAAAQAMYEKANTLAAEGKHGEAESAARAAKKLAAKAQQKALLRKDECLNPEGVKGATPADPNAFAETDPGAGVALDAQEALKTVYFGFNAAELSNEARDTLANNAAWINKHLDKTIIIEGHCDERGSTEYNLALGERRALVVRKYLGQLGVDLGRVEVVSYGEEQPADYASNDAAYTRNRRAEFRTR
ncbi:MAG: OmpA family protein [Myxococcales bacterium]|nr:OmpA family protein [Myxococcales bacterium]